jgi:lysophospholipid acyltransferase (LPLAT)-like uncharacterized protein
MIVSRPTKFFIIEKLLLPLAIVPLRGLIKTWRICPPESPKMTEIAATQRIVLATYHGMLFHLLAFAPLASLHGRRIVVMTSPSYDGRLLAAFLRHFDIGNVSASSRSRNTAGSKEFIRRIRAGDIGLIAVDGPRGPRGVVKPGFLRIAAVARAHLLLAATSANRGVSFRTWDLAHLPGPFARIVLSMQLLSPPGTEEAERGVSCAGETLRMMARQIASPVVGGLVEQNDATRA